MVFNKTKIVATVGPACNTKEMLSELAEAGVDVFRLNFSHGTHEEHAKIVRYVRELNEENGWHLCMLQDLQGPKIRVGNVENGGVEISAGQELTITTMDMMGNAQKISTVYEALPQDVNIGDMILIDDGKIELRVLEINGNEVKTVVIYGGILKSKKGINLPQTRVSAPSLTEKDLADLEFGLEHEIEWIALSFVRSSRDILELKEKIKSANKLCRVIAKIEKPEALKNIDEIIEVSDGLMVARGDLGVEIHMEEVPMAQKMIVSKCNLKSKPVIIATQIMESMITNPRPTRAETNDIANAVMDGADALMLSAETAAGKYPLQVVRSMTRTISSVEENADIYDKFHVINPDSPTFFNDSIVLTACRLSKETKAKALIGMTKSGYNALRLSGHRPKADIFIFTDNRPLLNTINLIWGVRGFYYNSQVSTDQTFADIEDILKKKGHLTTGDIFINTASMPLRALGRTNMLKIKKVE